MTTPSAFDQTVAYFSAFFQNQISGDRIRAIVIANADSPALVFPNLLSIVQQPGVDPAPPSPIPAPISSAADISTHSEDDDPISSHFSIDLHGFTKEYAALYLRRILLSWAIKKNYTWTIIHGKGIHSVGQARLPTLTCNMARAHGIECSPGANAGQTVVKGRADHEPIALLFGSHVRWNLRGVLEKQEAPLNERSNQGRLWIMVRTMSGEEKAKKGARENAKQIGHEPRGSQAI
jgi:hypothetical protein